MTGDDLKRLQDTFVEGSKDILRASPLRPVGFVVTLREHVDKIFESGWGLEFLDPKECLRDGPGDGVAVLIIDLTMDWKRLYYAVLDVYPKTREVLSALIEVSKLSHVDDVYKRVMRPFLHVSGLDRKDVIAAMMQMLCAKVDVFASIFNSEAWRRDVDPSETAEEIRKKAQKSLGQDQKSVEVIYSVMETYDFTRVITVPVQRETSPDPDQRDGGKVLGFGATFEDLAAVGGPHVIEGRLARFLKPLKSTP